MHDCFVKVNGKRAQVGETMTWVVATLVIIVILSLSILFVKIGSFGFSDFGNFNLKRTSDFLAAKSFVNYLSTSENGKTVYQKLRDGANAEDSLSKNISKFYSGDYQTTGGTYGISVCNSDPNDPTCSNEEFEGNCQIFYRVYLTKDSSRFVVLCFHSK